MSTDIIRFEKTGQHASRKVYQPKALNLYAATSLPLVAVTIFLSYAFYFWATRGERSHKDADCENQLPAHERFRARLREALENGSQQLLCSKVRTLDHADSQRLSR